MSSRDDEEFDIDLEGPGSERRQSPRERMRLGVRFRSAGDLAQALQGTTHNISMGGLCLRTKKAYERGTRLELTLALGDGQSLTVDAIVAWVRPGQAVGVRFDMLTPQQIQTLKTLLEPVLGKR